MRSNPSPERLIRVRPHLTRGRNSLSRSSKRSAPTRSTRPTSFKRVRCNWSRPRARRPPSRADARALGEIHRAADKPELAEQAYLDAVASAEHAVGPNDPAMTSTLDSLANLYYYRDEFDKVAPIYERILKISQIALAQAERQVAVRSRNLADVDERLKNHAAAEPLYQEALAAGERSGRTFRPELIQDTLAVAAFYRSRGKYDEAAALAEHANHMAEHTAGPNSMDVALCLDSLAETRLAAGKPTEAEPLGQRTLAISEKLAGPDSADLAPRLVTLAKIDAALQKNDEAQTQFDRALALTEKNLGADSPEMVALLGQYADLLDSLGKRSEANARRKQADLILHPEVHEPTPAE